MNFGYLMKSLDSSLYNFSNADGLVDSSAHSLQDDGVVGLLISALLRLQETNGIRNVVAWSALAGDADLIGLNVLLLLLLLRYFDVRLLFHI